MPLRINSAMRWVTTRVLPVPAPASTSNGPASVVDGGRLGRVEGHGGGVELGLELLLSDRWSSRAPPPQGPNVVIRRPAAGCGPRGSSSLPVTQACRSEREVPPSLVKQGQVPEPRKRFEDRQAVVGNLRIDQLQFFEFGERFEPASPCRRCRASPRKSSAGEAREPGHVVHALVGHVGQIEFQVLDSRNA